MISDYERLAAINKEHLWHPFTQMKDYNNSDPLIIEQHECWTQTEKYDSARDFLHSVKAMGASASEAVTIPDLGSRQLFFQMFKEYESKYRMQGGVFATYDLLLIQTCDSRE